MCVLMYIHSAGITLLLVSAVFRAMLLLLLPQLEPIDIDIYNRRILNSATVAVLQPQPMLNRDRYARRMSSNQRSGQSAQRAIDISYHHKMFVAITQK